MRTHKILVQFSSGTASFCLASAAGMRGTFRGLCFTSCCRGGTAASTRWLRLDRLDSGCDVTPGTGFTLSVKPVLGGGSRSSKLFRSSKLLWESEW